MPTLKQLTAQHQDKLALLHKRLYGLNQAKAQIQSEEETLISEIMTERGILEGLQVAEAITSVIPPKDKLPAEDRLPAPKAVVEQARIEEDRKHKGETK